MKVSSRLAVVCAALALLPASCGPIAAGKEPPVDFAFTMGGRQRTLAELRGRPVVLVLMRTAEMSSQAYMTEVTAAFRATGGAIRYLVLTLEPAEAPLVAPFAEFMGLPFEVGVAERAVAEGRTALGVLPAAPITLIFDSSGRVFDAASGVVRAEELGRAIARALGR
ncbi:MAG: hypothetical protein PHU25_17420 [Deltaproteobacteria bacterium]|nr:hypothetical protein [Deltaproteobacteria bacterium]